MRLASCVLVPLLAASALAQGGGYGGGNSGKGGGNGGGDGGGKGGGDEGGDASSTVASTTTTTSSAASTPSSGSASSTASSTLTGGKQCVGSPQLMCITALVNATTTTYQLSQSGSTKAGWMAIGFGQTMANSPMVIMWANANGQVTLSQRQAPSEVEPTVVASPPRVATFDTASSDLTAAAPTWSFTIATAGTGTSQNLIWAFGDTQPSSSQVDANLAQHINSGPIVLDVSTPIASTGGNPTVPTASGSTLPPLLYYQKLVVAHAIVFAFAFMLMLPTGALFARYLRTSTPGWFKGHYLIQFYGTAPVILIGFVIAICAVQQHGSGHFNDKHKLVGLVIVILYVVQCSLGGIIHFIKNANRTRRPPQNYLHAVLGLGIIGLALYQVHLGYDTEWPNLTGRGAVSSGVKVVWTIWAVLLPVLYAVGLLFLRRQFRQEADGLAARLGQNKMEMRARRAYSGGHPYDALRDADAMPYE